ncbi:MAG TPA: TetR/AcrR family transcriptional regulator [Aldersonia sp.]
MSSPGRGGKARAQRREDLLRAILTESERVLREEELRFSEVSVDRLAAAAGISRATFYLYFEDKGHLLRLFMRHFLGEASESARLWWDVAELRDPERLVASARSMIATYRKNYGLLSAIIEAASYDRQVADEYAELVGGFCASTTELIERGQAAGSIRPLPAPEVAATLTWMVERVLYQSVGRADESGDDALALALAEVLHGALYLEPATSADAT